MLLLADWVIPVSSAPLADAGVRVAEGRITEVGPAAQLRARYEGDEVRSFPGCALLPGFVNSHTHLELSAFRGFARPSGFGRWMLRLLLARRKLDPADLRSLGAVGRLRMPPLRHHLARRHRLRWAGSGARSRRRPGCAPASTRRSSASTTPPSRAPWSGMESAVRSAAALRPRPSGRSRASRRTRRTRCRPGSTGRRRASRAAPASVSPPTWPSRRPKWSCSPKAPARSPGPTGWPRCGPAAPGRLPACARSPTWPQRGALTPETLVIHAVQVDGRRPGHPRFERGRGRALPPFERPPALRRGAGRRTPCRRRPRRAGHRQPGLQRFPGHVRRDARRARAAPAAGPRTGARPAHGSRGRCRVDAGPRSAVAVALARAGAPHGHSGGGAGPRVGRPHRQSRTGQERRRDRRAAVRWPPAKSPSPGASRRDRGPRPVGAARPTSA